MSLATRCPQCNTLFKVTSGQLQLHEGQVRCGTCRAVFSGIEHLTSADTEAWQQLDFSQSGNTAEQGLPAPSPNTPDVLFASHPKTLPLLNFRQGSIAVKSGCTALFLLLAFQLAWFNRLALVQQSPSLATWVDQAGEATRLLFSNPATRALQVEGSGLQALDEHNLRVDLTLQNKQVLPARWPHLKVDLLDPQGLVLASKTLTPSEYQVLNQEAASQSQLISGNSTVEVLAYLNISTLNAQLPEIAATGFRLELFDQGPSVNP